MTTHKEEYPEELAFYDTLRKLLAPYEPATDMKEADKLFTTNEIISALELHYGIPQGDPERGGIDGGKLVEWMTKLGYTCGNIGDLQLQWLLKKKLKD